MKTKEYDGWGKNTFSEDKCMNCSSKNLRREDDYNSWVREYVCLDCKSKHILSYGDSMGGQRNSLTVYIPE